MSRSKRVRTETSSPASMAIRSAWESSAPARRIARSNLRTGLPLASFASGTRTIDKEIRSAGPAIGADTACWSTASGAPRERRGPGRHRAAGSRLLAANAAARRGRRARPVAVRVSAPARQRDGAGIAARRRVVQDLRSEDCRRHRHAVGAATDQAAPPAGRLSRGRAARLAGRLPNPVQGRRCQRQRPAARPRATTTSCSGTFTIFCSTRAARKAGTPIRWAAFIPMPA